MMSISYNYLKGIVYFKCVDLIWGYMAIMMFKKKKDNVISISVTRGPEQLRQNSFPEK